MKKLLLALSLLISVSAVSAQVIVVPPLYNAHTSQTPTSTGTNVAASERGNWFHASVPGLVRFGKYYKAAGTWADTVTIRLWDVNHTLISSCQTNTYGTESSAAGWQVCPLLAFIPANTDFFISYSSTGSRDIKYSLSALGSDVGTSSMFIKHDTTSAHNGFYGTAGQFPTTLSGSGGTDYFLDVSFIPALYGVFE